jgi:hypothetical protein
MEWDTVDELLCKFYNWKVITDDSLIVKHLKPTGANHNKTRYKQVKPLHLGYVFSKSDSIGKLAIMKKNYLLYRLHKRF